MQTLHRALSVQNKGMRLHYTTLFDLFVKVGLGWLLGLVPLVDHYAGELIFHLLDVLA